MAGQDTAPEPSAQHTRPRAESIGDVLLLAAGGALVAALGHVVYTEVRFRLFDLFTWTSREFAWLAPIGYLTCFLVVALPLLVAVRLIPRFTPRVAAAIFATLAIFSLLLLYPHIHPLAELALAVGVGVQVSRLVVAGRPWRRWVARLSVVSALVCAALGAVFGAGWGVRERLALSRRPAARTDAPDIILLILDTVRAANLGTYGYARPTTPVLDRLAEAGVVFEWAFATSPWTAPSHASMMTGRWASETLADYLSAMDPRLPTVAEVLSRRGYATGGFMANTGYAGHQVGLARSFAHYEDYPVNFRQALWSTTLTQTESGRQLLEGIHERSWWKVLSAFRRFDLRVIGVRQGERQFAERIADRYFAWRDALGPAAGPHFAMLNFMDAHAPYAPPAAFRTRFDSGRREVDRYDGGIAYMDSILGSIVQRLRERGTLDRTVLIVTSDHGEQWGEHGLESHGNSLYLPLLHVPLVVHAPGRVKAGRRLATLVSLRDLAATIVDVAGEGGGTASGTTLPGTSLAGLWDDRPGIAPSPIIAEVSPAINPAPRNPTRRGPMKATLDSAWHYVRFGDGVEELYAWRRDPLELHDLAGVDSLRAVVAQQRARISATLRIPWLPRPSAYERP